jgi:hypothetical protein
MSGLTRFAASSNSLPRIVGISTGELPIFVLVAFLPMGAEQRRIFTIDSSRADTRGHIRAELQKWICVSNKGWLLDAVHVQRLFGSQRDAAQFMQRVRKGVRNLLLTRVEYCVRFCSWDEHIEPPKVATSITY